MAKGGYREGSGRAKTGYYQNIYCGSTYELCWVIYNLDHEIPFRRFEGILEHNGKKYIPDFLIAENLIVEIKGFEAEESVAAKTAVAEHHGFKVIVMRAEQLQYAFDYVKEQYNTTQFHQLYQDYRPEYKYFCSFCNAEFGVDRPKKTEEKFCSRICAGKMSRQVSNDAIERGNYNRSFDKQTALDIYHDQSGSLSELAVKYNTTKNSIFFIKSKKNYKWIHE